MSDEALYTLGFNSDGLLLYCIEQGIARTPVLPAAVEIERDLMLVDAPRLRDRIVCNGPILPWGGERPYAFAVDRPPPYKRLGNAGKGSAPVLDGGARISLYLDERTRQRAKDIGRGVVSEGVRIAVRMAFAQLAPASARSKGRGGRPQDAAGTLREDELCKS